MFKMEAIGEVRNNVNSPTSPEKMVLQESTIIIKPEFAEGLDGIEKNEYLQILFYIDQKHEYKLKGERRGGEERGLFASRSPHRPNPIGLTKVRLMKREGQKLIVKGLDALNGTSVLDIKPYVPNFDRRENVKIGWLEKNVRKLSSAEDDGRFADN